MKSNLLSKRSLFFRSKGILCADIECKKFKKVKKRKENDMQRKKYLISNQQKK